MVALFISAFALAQAVPNVAPTQKIIGFDCADRFDKSSRRRVNIDLTDHAWQDEDGEWHKIAAEYANSLTLMDATDNRGSRRNIQLDRFKLELSEVDHILPVNSVVMLTYVCRMGPPIDMMADRKF